MAKPDWKDAPDWAQFRAMDDDGRWYWYSDKPEWDGYQWQTDGDASYAAGVSPSESLEPRQ